MKWTSAISDEPVLQDAVDEVCRQAQEDLGGQAADLAIVFISPHHAGSYDVAPKLFDDALSPKALLGCSGAGVIGAGHEIESRPAVAVCAASLPGVGITTFEFEEDELPTMDAPPDAWEELIGPSPGDCPAILLLPDPFSISAGNLIAGLDYAYPDTVKVGGLASGGNGRGANALINGMNVNRSGVVGAAFTGDLTVDAVVAQGCKPIGRPMLVTESYQNVIRGLDGGNPLEALRSLFEQASDEERMLIRGSLQIGLVMDPLNDSFTAGDFLMRNVLGAEEDSGAIAVGEIVPEGQVVQFHVRDASAADDDLRAMLDRYAGSLNGAVPASALLFTCLGRGQYLFGSPDHDTGLFREMVAPVPLAGFFCNGEIGPVGDTTFLHGYTSSFAVFRRPRAAAHI